MPNSSGLISVPGSASGAFVAAETGCWMVRSGYVDLFLAPSDQDPPLRWHLMRVRAGNLLYGLPAAAHGMMLTVHPSPGSQVDEVAPNASAADPWIEQLAEACQAAAAPKEFTTLERERAVEATEARIAVYPVAGVAWVRLVKGNAFVCGGESHPVAAGAAIPVSRKFWLSLEPGAALEPASTPDLGRFHQIVMTLLRERRARDEARERDRLAAKQRAARTEFEGSLDALRSPLEGEAAAGPAARHSVAAVRACELIGAEFGVAVQPPSELNAHPRSVALACARISGMRGRRVLLREGWWTNDGGPMIAFREKDSAPVVITSRRGAYRIVDPVDGSSVPATAKTARALIGSAYLFYRPLPARPLKLGDIVQFGLNGCGRDLASIAALGALSGLLAMAPPIATGILFDSVIVSAERPNLVLLGASLVVAAICAALLQLASGFATLRVESRMAASLQAALWDRLLALPATFFRSYTSGDLASRSMAIERIRQAVTGAVMTSVLAGVFSLFQVALLFEYNAHMAVPAVGLLLVAALAAVAAGWAEVRFQREIAARNGKLTGLVSQLLNGIAKIRVAGAERLAFAHWARMLADRENLNVRARRVSNSLTVFNTAFPPLALAWIYWIGVEGPARPSPGEFLAFTAAFQALLFAVLQVGASVVPVMSVAPEYERVRPILEAVPESGVGKMDPGPLSGSVEVNHVSFRYRPGLPLVLNEMSFRVRPGEFVAFIGESGCGKSTVFRTLLGFEKPESGAVYYDNQALDGLDIAAVRRQIGVVLQNGQLMAGDLLNNIIGSNPLSIEDAWEAARMAGLDEDVKQMPMGMHTMISEGGGGLSGGQRQRLLIARAIVNKPSIILFDEATSALDNATQAVVSASLERLKATRIVIAHRLSTIRNADRIFVMHRGQIVESGNYEQLMEANGLFADMARRQTTEGID